MILVCGLYVGAASNKYEHGDWCNDNLQWKTTMLQEKLVSLPLLQPQMQHGLSRD